MGTQYPIPLSNDQHTHSDAKKSNPNAPSSAAEITSQEQQNRTFTFAPSVPLHTLDNLSLLTLVLQAVSPETLDERIVHRLCEAYPTLHAIERAGHAELLEIKGLSSKHIFALQAAFVLGRRTASTPLQRGQPFLSSQDVFEAYASSLAVYEQETFWVLLLDTRNRLLKELHIAQGSTARCYVGLSDIFAPALREKAMAMIILHNHPSGHPEPSAEDCELTQRVQETCQLLGIKLLDHVILAENDYVSFADRGWL